MIQELQKKMEEFHMLSAGDRVVAGVSGGADSVCLLLVLHALQEKMDFSLEVVHVEHGIRGEESIKDAEFVEELCRRFQVPCHKVSVDVPAYCKRTGLGTEEAARILRYEIFAEYALEQGAKIALAHHMEDNAETILFQMVRGSSLAGVCGMQPVRVDEKGISYIRPLLFFHRAQIESFLKERGISWRIDSTNAQLEYSRNFLRGQVIPELAQINTRAVEHINQTARDLTEIKEYLDAETEKVWAQIAKMDEKLILDARAIQELYPVMQRQIAYKAITFAAKRKKDITSVHVADLLDLCKGQSGKCIALPYGISARKEYDKVYLSQIEDMPETVDFQPVYEVTAEMLEESARTGVPISIRIEAKDARISCRVFENGTESLEILRKTYTKWLDYDKIKQGFCIRTRRSGDYFISDALGHRKKLKSYFIDEKIPVSERDGMWMLARESEVLWLIGGRISEHVKISPKTKYVFEITYDGGKNDE